MSILTLTRSQRLIAVIAISFSFFLLEIIIGITTHSLALVADAFHVMNDLIGFAVALTATQMVTSGKPVASFSFGWQRAELLGGFFNGVFLIALGVSILLQSIERFVTLQKVDNPKLVFIVGAIGLVLNVISALFMHEHGHGHGHSHGPSNAEALPHDHQRNVSSVQENQGYPAHATVGGINSGTHAHHNHATRSSAPSSHANLGILGVMIHLLGDAANNAGVMISALVIWFAKYEGRYYADPAVSMGIAIMIFASAIPLVRSSGRILLESASPDVKIGQVREDLERLPGVAAVHELHIWRLDESKSIATAHIATVESSLDKFMDVARNIRECLHAYDVHSATIQPEYVEATSMAASTARSDDPNNAENGNTTLRQRNLDACQLQCMDNCQDLTCCKETFIG